MIEAQASEMGENQTWPEYLDQEMMYFLKSKEMDFSKNHPESEIVSTLQHTLSLSKK